MCIVKTCKAFEQILFDARLGYSDSLYLIRFRIFIDADSFISFKTILKSFILGKNICDDNLKNIWSWMKCENVKLGVKRFIISKWHFVNIMKLVNTVILINMLMFIFFTLDLIRSWYIDGVFLPQNERFRTGRCTFHPSILYCNFLEIAWQGWNLSQRPSAQTGLLIAVKQTQWTKNVR